MIIRTPHRDRYVIISKVPLEDARLSWKARGLHAYLMSKPDGWQVITNHLVTQSEKDGRAAVISALRELEDLGYIRRFRIKDEQGHFTGWDQEVHEEPPTSRQAENRTIGDRQVGFPTAENPIIGKSATSEERLLVKKEKSERQTSEKFDALWDRFPRQRNRQATHRRAKALILEGTDYEDLLQAVENYAKFVVGVDEQFIKASDNFFADDFWRDWLNVPVVKEPAQPPDGYEVESAKYHAESVPPPEGFAASVRKQMADGL